MESDVKKMIKAKVSNVLTFLKEDKGKWNIFHRNRSPTSNKFSQTSF